MSDTSIKFKDGATLVPVDLTTLLHPQAGDIACDINDSNKIKRYDAVGLVWVELGSGSGGGTSDPDFLAGITFDTLTTADFTQVGLSLTSANPMHGAQTARLIHQPVAEQYFGQTISVDPKFRGVNITTSMLVRSTASEGNVTLLVTDLTNSTTLTSQSIGTASQAVASLTTTISSLTVGGFTNTAINALSVGMSVTGSGISTGTRIASINATALTITLSAVATATATATLRFSALPKTVQERLTLMI
jgi:hypothetical protein